MKKLFPILFALALVFGMTTAVMAAYPVEMDLTSEAITGAANACEKYGSMSITFKAGTVLKDGDWLYADLPLGAQICKTFDFAILGDSDGNNSPATQTIAPVPNIGGNGVWVTTAASGDGATDDYGPSKIKDLASLALAQGITVDATTSVATGIWFRVSGTAGAQRIWVKIYDNETIIVGDVANANGSSSLTVDQDAEFSLTVFDGEPWNNVVTAKNPNGFIWAYNDTDGDGQYGEEAANADFLQAANNWDNYLCGEITTLEGNYVNLSYDSGGKSGDDFLTFSGEHEIAHKIAADLITLEACIKKDLYGNVEVTFDPQTGVCTYEYDTAAGYCPDIGTENFTKLNTYGVVGNRLIIQQSVGNFGTNTDKFQVILRITTGDGTYFMAAPTDIDGFLPNTAKNWCTTVAGAGDTTYAPVWVAKNRGGGVSTTWSTGACAATASDAQVQTLTSAVFGVGTLDTISKLVVDVPAVAFDPNIVLAGGFATVEVELVKVPCGSILTDTRTIAEYVDTCATAAPVTTLLFPYTTPLNDTSWWFGMSFCNPNLVGAIAGTALITVYEADGDIGTYTTASVAAGEMVTYGGAELLALLTADAGNTGTLGDDRSHIIVVCDFAAAGGFGMMGDGSDSTGYVAYGNSAAWNY